MTTQFEEAIRYINRDLKKWMTDDLLPKAVNDLPTLNCGCCGEILQIGDSIQYNSDYEAYCQNWDCVDGIATSGTCLENCWWGEKEDFWDIWDEVIKESKENSNDMDREMERKT